MLAVIIMGSPGDEPVARRVSAVLDGFGIPWEMRIGSAHKTPGHLLAMLEAYEADPRPKVYVTIAGRSNALSGLVDAQVAAPVIACPPYSEAFAGGDVLSSLRVPSGVAPAVVLEPEAAGLLAAKMLGLAVPSLRQGLVAAREAGRRQLLDADAALHGG